MSASEVTSDGVPLFRVMGGGDPSPEQLAALTVAVLSLAGDGHEADPSPSGWQRAAIAEAVGGRVRRPWGAFGPRRTAWDAFLH